MTTSQKTSKTSNFHEFEVDDNIVNDLIYRQNGTAATALGELVMNAIDAGTEKIEILINSEGFEIRDNGKGFADEDAVMRFFKRFGTPHLEGDATFGRFRIGRGQIMAFAKTTWHSRNFKMTTDIGSGATGFEFEKDAAGYEGCKVSGKFYKPLDKYDLSQVHESLSDRVRYVPTPVFINQVQVNSSDRIRWDYEDDLIKIAFNPQGRYSLKLYSLGIFVKELHIHQYGMQADVVTKQALQLNMARNEVNQEDPVWLHVHSVLRAEMRKRKRGAKTLSENERSALIDQLLFGEVSLQEVASLPLLKDFRGKSTSLINELRKKRPWSAMDSTTPGSCEWRLGDQISSSGSALVLSREELDLWRSDSIESLLQRLMTNILESESSHPQKNRNSRDWNRYYLGVLGEVAIVDFATLARGLSTQYELISQRNLTPLQRAQRNALQYALNIASGRLGKSREDQVSTRKLVIGDGLATAWTDSSTYVAINRNALSYFENGIPGLLQLSAILLHELTHESGSVLENGHDLAFYEHFHDAVLCGPIGKDVLGNTIQSLQSRYTVELQKAKLAMPKWMDSDDLRTVVLELTSSTPNALLTWVLESVGVPYKKGRGEVRIQAYMQQLWDMPILVSKAAMNLLKSHKLKPASNVDFAHIEDFQERHEAVKTSNKKLLCTALALEGLDNADSTLEVLSDFNVPREDWVRWQTRVAHSRMGNFSVLTRAPAFGVLAVETINKTEVRFMAGRDFFFEKAVDRRDNVGAKKLAIQGKEARFEEYRGVLENLVSGIKDPAERVEFSRRFLSEEFRRTV